MLSTFGAKFLAILAAIGGILLLVGTGLMKVYSVGKAVAKGKQAEKVNEIRDKMDAVDRPSSDDVDDSLSNNKF